MAQLVHRTLLILALSIVTMLMPAYSATVTTYTDGAIFSQMTQNMSTIDSTAFNALVSGPGGWNLNMTSSGFLLGDPGNLVQFLGIMNGSTYYTNISWGQNNQKDWGPTSHAILESSQNSTDPNWRLHIALPGAGATAIGLDLMTWLELFPWNGTNYQAGGNFTITLSTGDVINPIATTLWNTSMGSSPRIAGLNPAFFAFTSDTPITWIDLRSDSGAMATDYFTFGSVKTQSQVDPGNPGDTPEVSTMLLIGTGLLAIRAAKKFRHLEA